MVRPYILFICVLVSCMAVTCVRDYPSTDPNKAPVVPNPPSGGLPAQTQQTTQKRLYLDNDKVRLGIDLNAGGAITYLSEAGSSVNIVNNNDLGRQIQTALYARPNPYSVNGKDPIYQWRNLGWNPVQTGDYYNHPAQVVSYQQGQNTLYVKTIPLIWPLFNEPADCTFEHWIELKDNTIHVRCRITVNRVDTTHYEARTQEFPCVYLTGPYYRMVTYVGLKPFTSDAVSEFTDSGKWYYRYSSEHWTALLNAEGRGVGLYRPGEVRFGTDKFGADRTGGEFDVSSGYMNTQPNLLVDYNGQYDYEYTLIVGSANDIRQYVYSQPRPATHFNYQFTNSRQGWYYTNTHDKGWPIQNELTVRWERDSLQKPRFLITSPMTVWYAREMPKIYINAAFQTKGAIARLVWLKPEEHFEIEEDPGRYVDFPIVGDGQFRTYAIDMSQLPGWNGVIAQIALTSPDSQYSYEKGSTVRIRSISSVN